MIGFLKRLFGGATPPSITSSMPPPMPRHDIPVHSSIEGNEDIIKGWQFCATLQLRTPLTVLQQHGRRVPRSPGGPPVVTTEMWQGIWTYDVGDEFSMFDAVSMASEVGSIPANGGDYLPFLIAFRTITEGGAPVTEKEAAMRALMKQSGPGGTPYTKYHKVKDLIDEVLPRTIALLPISRPVRSEVVATGLNTLAKVEAASDKELLAINGLGPKSLAGIRALLATTTADKNAQRYAAEPYTRQS
ncbi:hypothetical protein [Pseudoxanthomonas mexicana]